MKLEEGMYVRTPKGISKITSMYNEPNQYIVYTDKGVTFEYYLDNKGQWVTDYVDKASHNIIDLIEVGDYVNGKPIAEIDEDFNMLFLEDNDKGWRTIVEKDNIETILTKEQYENNCYKIGDE